MAVQVWVGEKPEHPNERRAIVALANGLERLDGLYLIVANFSVGGNSIDLVIIKSDAVFIIELKHCDGKVIGGVNGPWFVEGANGERKRLNPGRKNPYNQVIAYFYALTNFLNEHRQQFVSDQKATKVDFRTCRRVVVIAPTLQADSQVELDWKVELQGLDALPAFLVTERSSEINLSDAEMLAIPKLLNCSHWKEINSLIAGVMPSWDAPEPSPAVPPPPPSPPPPPPPPPSLTLRAQTALRTTTGRIAAGLGVIVMALLLILALRPTRIVIPPLDQPQLLSGTTAIPGVFAPSSGNAQRSTCVWSGFQPVGKRWNRTAHNWEAVPVGGPKTENTPEIIVTLEQVVYCSDRMSLTWSVKNASEQTIELPLRNNNIAIRDMLGNDYMISESDSTPLALRVEPQLEARGTAVVLRPISQNASSLLVRLKTQPFGEASWLVVLDE